MQSCDGNDMTSLLFIAVHGLRLYTVRLLLQHCLQRAVVDRCLCRDISLPAQSDIVNVTFCSDDSDIPDHCRKNASEDCFQVCMCGVGAHVRARKRRSVHGTFRQEEGIINDGIGKTQSAVSPFSQLLQPHLV